MEEYIIHPLISTITSIILLLGCYELGKFLIKKFSLNEILSKVSILYFQNITFGLIFLLIIIFPFTAFLNKAETILKWIAIILIIFGIKNLFNFKNYFKKIKSYPKNFQFKLYILILILFFLLSLSPLTSADVLDYHAGMALNILRFDKYILLPEWFTGIQSGAGETLIALGFVVGAEQFGSLVQFTSLLTISGIILKFTQQNNSNIRYFILLSIFSCPILIFLLSGNKPQAFYSSLIFMAFSLNFINTKNQNEILKAYTLINILICISVMGKFSFNLSGFLIWLYSTYNFINKKNFYKIILIPILVFIFIYLPFLYWKYINLGGNIFSYIFSPFPLHLPGYDTFLSHNRGSQEIPFPNFIFYTSLSRLTEFLAANPIIIILLIFLYKKNKNIVVTLTLVFLFVVVSNLYASPSARYYLDVILWITLVLCMTNFSKFYKIFKLIFYPQILIVIVILIYSNYLFLPGAFSKKNYKYVKNNYGYMYSGFEWLNKNVPEDSNVIIINRPISLYNNFAISGNFNYFTNKEESKYYKNIIKKYNPEFIAYLGNNPDFKHFQNCIDEIYLKQDRVGFHATRNPFNKGSYYNVYLAKLNQAKLPNC